MPEPLTIPELEALVPGLRWFPLELPEEPRSLEFIGPMGDWLHYGTPQFYIVGAYAARYDGWLIVYGWYQYSLSRGDTLDTVFITAPELDRRVASAVWANLTMRWGLTSVHISRTNIPLAEFNVYAVPTGHDSAILMVNQATSFGQPYVVAFPREVRNRIQARIHFYAAIIESFLRPERQEMGAPWRRT